MGWPEEYIIFGTIRHTDRDVYVHSSRYNFISLKVGTPFNHVVDARWAGNSIDVYLSNGKIVKYVTPHRSYTF